MKENEPASSTRLRHPQSTPAPLRVFRVLVTSHEVRFSRPYKTVQARNAAQRAGHKACRPRPDEYAPTSVAADRLFAYNSLCKLLRV